MKKFLLIILLVVLTGCTNQEEKIRNEYIAKKSHLMAKEITSTKLEDLQFEIITNLERMNEEEIKYQVILTNPKENMHKIKGILVHNFYNEEIFPSIGVFDEEKEDEVLQQLVKEFSDEE